MFNSIGWGEIMVLLVVALFIFGPDRLPTMAKEAAGALQKVRGFVTGARAQLRDELGDEFADIDLRSLNPREFVRRQLLDDDPQPMIKRSNGTGARSAGARLDTTKVTGNRVDTTKPASARMGDSAPRPVQTAPAAVPGPGDGSTDSSVTAVAAAAPPPYDADAT